MMVVSGPQKKLKLDPKHLIWTMIIVGWLMQFWLWQMLEAELINHFAIATCHLQMKAFFFQRLKLRLTDQQHDCYIYTRYHMFVSYFLYFLNDKRQLAARKKYINFERLSLSLSFKSSSWRMKRIIKNWCVWSDRKRNYHFNDWTSLFLKKHFFSDHN